MAAAGWRKGFLLGQPRCTCPPLLPTRVVAWLAGRSRGRQHLLVSAGRPNFSSACFSSSWWSVSCSARCFSWHCWMSCSRPTEDCCCSSRLLGMSWGGESTRTQPISFLRAPDAAAARFLHHGPLQAHVLKKSSSTRG